jgi:hypothetical protein
VSYLDLRASLDDTGTELRLPNAAAKAIRRVYKHLLLTGDRQHRATSSNAVGFAAGLKGDKKEEVTTSTNQSDVLPFEFAEFTDELVSNVLEPQEKSHVIFLCDEANQMPIYRQEQVLERYLELFSMRRAQFLFVAGLLPSERTPYLPSCFATQLELRGFPERRFVRELIDRAIAELPPPRLEFSDEAVDTLYETFGGHPRLTLDACARAYEAAASAGRGEVGAGIIVRVCKDQKERAKAIEEALARPARE